MITKINEIRTALDAQLYNCALALALTLPDICAKVEYHNRPNWRKGKKYQEWFDNYAKQKFTYRTTRVPSNETIYVTTMDGETCWALRCAVLHAGNYNVSSKSKYEKIGIHAHRADGLCFEHEVVDGKRIEVDVTLFCRNICVAAETYYQSIKDKRLFEIDEVRILTW